MIIDDYYKTPKPCRRVSILQMRAWSCGKHYYYVYGTTLENIAVIKSVLLWF